MSSLVLPHHIIRKRGNQILKIKKIILSQFKGVASAEYQFDGNTIVSGANGTGKTTLADAWFWLFTDKDYSLKSNPEVHPLDMEESEPTVEVICDIDGKEVSLLKRQLDARTKKAKEKGDPVKIKNTFEINAVPMSQTDFDAKLNAYGIDPKQFLLLTHPEIFMGYKTADCRKILFGMTTDVTDMSIAQKSGFAETAKLLESYTAEEITAMQKRTKKESENRIDAIPNEIIGLEKARTVIDVSALTEQATSLQAKIDSAESEMKENTIPSAEQLSEQVLLINQKMRMLNEDADHERRIKYESARNSVSAIAMKLQSRRKELTEREAVVANELCRVQNAKKEFDRLGEEFGKAKAEQFDETSNICKYCGQPLPADAAEENKQRFATAKQEKMDAINRAALEQRNVMRDAQDKAKTAEEGIPEIKSAISELEHQLTEAETNVKIFETPTDATSAPEYKKLESELKTLNQKIVDRDRMISERAEQEVAIRAMKTELRAVQDRLALSQANERIDIQIEELRDEQKQKAQVVADAEKILYQLAQINAQKNTLLEEQVNSHFSKVRFKLFEQLKNGDYKDCCVPVIDGKVLGQSANTAREILAKLDIIQGLQEYYKADLPVFLDGAEALDSENSNIDVPYQLIMLKVTDDPELKIS